MHGSHDPAAALLTLSHLAFVATYHAALPFVFRERGPYTLNRQMLDLLNFGAIGAGAFGVLTYWVIAHQVPHGLRPRWIYIGRWLSGALLVGSLVMLRQFGIAHQSFLIEPSGIAIYLSMFVMHKSLKYFEDIRPPSWWLTTVLLVCILPFSLSGAAVPTIAKLVICLLLVYRLARIWLMPVPATADQCATGMSGL